MDSQTPEACWSASQLSLLGESQVSERYHLKNKWIHIELYRQWGLAVAALETQIRSLKSDPLVALDKVPLQRADLTLG